MLLKVVAWHSEDEMNDSPAQMRAFLLGLGKEFDEQVDAAVAGFNSVDELPELMDHADPFGMEWSWLFGN